jgi:hypothetical protein
VFLRAVSIIGWIIIAILVISEVSEYRSHDTHIKEHMLVDTTIGSNLKISMNITFHGLRCSEVGSNALNFASMCLFVM